MTTERLRPARPEEAHALTELALRSKSHWGYDATFLQACRAELKVEPDACLTGRVIVAEEGHALLGFYRLAGKPPHGELGALFVDLPVIGRGAGARLLRHALAAAADLGYTSLTLDADPGAEAFYRHHGAVWIGEVASNVIAGRTLPQLRFTIPSR